MLEVTVLLVSASNGHEFCQSWRSKAQALSIRLAYSGSVTFLKGPHIMDTADDFMDGVGSTDRSVVVQHPL